MWPLDGAFKPFSFLNDAISDPVRFDSFQYFITIVRNNLFHPSEGLIFILVDGHFSSV